MGKHPNIIIIVVFCRSSVTDDGEYESVQMPCGCILSIVHIITKVLTHILLFQSTCMAMLYFKSDNEMVFQKFKWNNIA